MHYLMPFYLLVQVAIASNMLMRLDNPILNDKLLAMKLVLQKALGGVDE
jgi:hypothetical protein